MVEHTLKKEKKMSYIEYLIGEYNNAHRRVSAFAVYLIGIMALAVVVNLVYRPLNGLIAFAVSCLMIWASTRAEAVTTFIGLGAAGSPASPLQGAKKSVRSAASYIASLLIWTNTIFLIAATMKFSQNFNLVMAVLPAIMVLALAEYAWDYKTWVAKPIAIGYAMVVIAITIASWMPSGIWYKTIGFNPIAKMSTSSTDSKKIKRFEKLEAKGDLTKEEQAEYDNLKSYFEKRSLVGKAKAKQAALEKARAEATPNQPTPITGREVEASKTRLYQPGSYNFKLAAGQETEWIKLPNNISFHTEEGAGAKYKVVHADGRVMDMNSTCHEPNQIFKFKADKASEIKLVIVS
jgi:hypothetical protein